jgi:hypothetical protein
MTLTAWLRSPAPVERRQRAIITGLLSLERMNGQHYKARVSLTGDSARETWKQVLSVVGTHICIQVPFTFLRHLIDNEEIQLCSNVNK